MALLFFRMLIAAFTVNSIAYYFISDQLTIFNCSIALWCFIEWILVFRDHRTNEPLEAVLPPLNQLCLMVRVFIQEIYK